VLRGQGYRTPQGAGRVWSNCGVIIIKGNQTLGKEPDTVPLLSLQIAVADTRD
jgi:hypothetical protein